MSNKELLFSVTMDDLEIQTFRSGGPGGQAQNKLETGVRLIHRQSGAVVESREARSQHANKVKAFLKLPDHPKFKQWHRLEVAKRLGQPTPEQLVDRAMAHHNLKVEVRDENGRWVEEGKQ